MKNPSGTKDDSMKITESKVYTSACGIKLAEIDLAFMINHTLVVILHITAIIFSKIRTG